MKRIGRPKVGIIWYRCSLVSFASIPVELGFSLDFCLICLGIFVSHISLPFWILYFTSELTLCTLIRCYLFCKQMNGLNVLSLWFLSSSNTGHGRAKQRCCGCFVSWGMHRFNHSGRFLSIVLPQCNARKYKFHINPGHVDPGWCTGSSSPF
jgi:hypothetical protein